MDEQQETKQAARAKLIAKFRSTAGDRLQRIANALLSMERDGYADEAAAELKREIHTLKGEAKLVGFADVSFLVHKIEELVLHADRQKFQIDPAVLDLILSGFDEVSVLLHPDTITPEVDLEKYTAIVDEVIAAVGAPSAAAAAESAPAILRAPAPQRVTQNISVEAADVEKVSLIVGSLLEEQARRDREFAAVSSLADRQRNGLERVAAALRRNRFADVTMLLSALRRENEELRSVLRLSREQSFSAALHLSELEERLRSMRMLPLSTIADAYPRAVRDLARSLGKQARFATTGDDVSVDTRVLSLLSEPLLHLLRNAVDHGIETPAERHAAGKAEEGTIELVAIQRGSRLIVTVRDDGRGLDAAAIRAAALERGVVTADDLRGMSDAAVQQLVFHAGFSTRRDVTEISGRGIGLDVVKRRIESVGGTVTLHATPNGTAFELNVPISLALVHVLVVRAGTALWAIPSTFIVTIVDPADAQRSEVAGLPVIRLDDVSIPLVDVPAHLGIVRGGERDVAASRKTIVVVRYGERTVAIEGIEIVEYRSVVQRQTDRFLEGIRLIEGTAALGDRQLAIILSPSELVSTALSRRRAATSVERQAADETPVILVVDDSDIARTIVADAMAAAGHRVLQAGNGSEALALLRRETADLVILDLDMPVMNGFEMLETMRGDERWREMPVVVLSSRGSDTDKRKALDLGADAYLVKSQFQPADLTEAARPFLARGEYA